MGKKRRCAQWTKDKKDASLGDVALSDFADAAVPAGAGRLKKSTAKLPLDSPVEDALEDDIEAQVLALKNTGLTPAKSESDDDPANDTGLILSDEIWMLLADYMRPQDVLKFCLICKSSYRIVNCPLFWIRLYKRYYNTKEYVPAFLKKHCLERVEGLKAKVVRSLYYTYPQYRASLARRTKCPLSSLLGQRCDLMWVQRARDKDINAGNVSQPILERWVYSFKLSRPSDENRASQTKKKSTLELLNYNPDLTCRLLEVISKEYVNPICVINMKLRKAVLDDRCVHLKFSSAPLSRFGTDFGAVDIYLRATEPPAVYDWWHPHFYNQQY
ncbi:Hypothetical protein NTJ_06410 [Nesidiocoris tenuis]|uniref:F-box domain-containing protein n=1 Tax=Nesidiocoris tenuis TaxID=355587 RepID=A0ABN7ARS5_9HEMI|nr:Hypothetical protein NTJ_06410 [Nesidiocoris tenuis]